MLMSDEHEILAPYGAAPSQATSADLERAFFAMTGDTKDGTN